MDNVSLRSPNPLDVMAMVRRPMSHNVDQRTLGGRLAGTRNWQNFELKAGADGQSNEHRKRVSVKGYRHTLGSVMSMTLRANPTAAEPPSDRLPSGFLRHERGLAGMPVIVYAGLGHPQRFPDYRALFSASPGLIECVQPMESLDPGKTTRSTSARPVTSAGFAHQPIHQALGLEAGECRAAARD
jgi:iron complex outermembrane receptor protein